MSTDFVLPQRFFILFLTSGEIYIDPFLHWYILAITTHLMRDYLVNQSQLDIALVGQEVTLCRKSQFITPQTLNNSFHDGHSQTK